MPDIPKAHQESQFVKHAPCPKCGSMDALGVYDDGHSHCFSMGCGYHTAADDTEIPAATAAPGTRPMIPTEYCYMASRGISEEVCARYKYGRGVYKGKQVHVANYTDSQGRVVAQKLRTADKKFIWLGNPKAVTFFGRSSVQPRGKRIIITEGEIDTLSVAEALSTGNWPVVSVPNGAQGAKKTIAAELKWLENFDEVVLLFDNDDAGRDAAAECAKLFTPGKCKIATIKDPYKDASDMVQDNAHRDLSTLVLFGGEEYRPDGIVLGSDPAIIEHIVNFEPRYDWTYPWECLQKNMFGIRAREITLVTAAPGIGKSTWLAEVAYHLGVSQGVRVGVAALEESKEDYGVRIASIRLDTRMTLHRPEASKEEIRRAAEETIGNGNFVLYDHFGMSQADGLLSQIRYMIKGMGCRAIMLDHITIAVNALGEQEASERQLIDFIMTGLRQLCQETDASIFVVSHLKRVNGKDFGEGDQISMADLRGSSSLEGLSNNILGLERNQQAESGGNVVTVRCLKNRYTGKTGVMGELEYDDYTGRYLQRSVDSCSDLSQFGEEGEEAVLAGVQPAPF